MTAPDVAALAAALDVAGIDPKTGACTLDEHHDEAFASLIIAALAAQGARIEFDADDDEREVAIATEYRRREQAAVRAALEGLRAEIRQSAMAWEGTVMALEAIDALIDARLGR